MSQLRRKHAQLNTQLLGLKADASALVPSPNERLDAADQTASKVVDA